jgi:hypothetical protein
VQIHSRSSSLPATKEDGHRMELLGPFGLFASLSPANLASLLCRWYVAFRSFRGHIRIQSATSAGRVDLGPAFQIQSGCLQENERTRARVEGIRKLRAIHPWADSVDHHIYLMGFDAGAEYGTGTLGVSQSTQDTPSTLP